MEGLLDKTGKFGIGFVLFFVFCLLAWQLIKTYSKDFMPVRYVRVSGIFQHLGKQEIKQLIEPFVVTDFVSADLQEIHDAALLLPWVAQAKVKRVWPDVIDIRITENQAAFRWGKEGLLNLQGELFKPQDTSEFSTLALIKGPLGHEYNLFNIMQELMTELAEQSLKINKFIVNERRSWMIVLEKGMQIQLGRREPAKNFSRFVKTLQVLGQEKIELIEKVDLRYPNGYSITWKSGAIPGFNGTLNRKHNSWAIEK